MGGALSFVAIAILVVTGAAARPESEVLAGFLAIRSELVTPAFMQVTALGNGLTVGVVALLVAGLLAADGRGRQALFVLACTTGGIVLHVVLKPLFGRARPADADWLVQATTLSFPSGHALNSTTTFVAVGVVLLWGAKPSLAARGAAAISFVIPVLVCVSRPYLGVHHPLDVLAGFALGIAWVAVCARSLPPREMA